jgi:hypothetical protein
LQPLLTVFMLVATAIIQLGVQVFLDGLTPTKPSRSATAAMQRIGLTVTAVSVLMLGHLCQVAIWAVRYWTWGELGGFVDSFYFSLASFTTVGASELDLSAAHRMTGAIESALGMIMFGWSTALLVSLIQRVQRIHGLNH